MKYERTGTYRARDADYATPPLFAAKVSYVISGLAGGIAQVWKALPELGTMRATQAQPMPGFSVFGDPQCKTYSS